MEIQVHSRSIVKRSLISAVALFYAQELKLHRSKCNLTVITVPGLLKDTGMRGGTTQISKHELSIAVDSRLSIETLLITLAHEMIHAKQYALGQLKVGTNGYIWLGKEYSTTYYESPWELQAFGLERVLANKIANLFV